MELTDNKLEEFLAKLDPKTRKRFKMAKDVDKDLLPSSSMTANYVLTGGFPRGGITTVYGNYSSGKSGLLLETIGHLQKRGMVCAWVDVENSYDKEWAARLGVDNDSLILIQHRAVGAIGDSVAPLLKAGIDFLVIDSISVVMPEAFLEDGELKEFDRRKQIGANARATGILLNGMLYDNHRTAIVLISQTRAADAGGGHMAMKPTGGQAVLFGSSVILKLTSSGTEKNQKMGKAYLGDKIHQVPIGREVDLYGEKNKIGPQSRKGTYTFYYGGEKVGIDHIEEVVSFGVMYGVVEVAGAWTKYDGRQWQGKEKFVDELKNNPAFYQKLWADVEFMMTGEVKDEPVGGISEEV